MKIQRDILTDLKKWKDSRHRKPLMLQGARQVGKSLKGMNISPEKTLIILDEIQECNDALNALKYFNELTREQNSNRK